MREISIASTDPRVVDSEAGRWQQTKKPEINVPTFDYLDWLPQRFW